MKQDPKKANPQKAKALFGREGEYGQILACIQAQRNVLLEGPVGVGKTHLALAVTKELGRPVFRIDGDARYTEQKLSGWFDPPSVIKQGFTAETFIPGPLVEAMRAGGVLFINELNRLPEGVQNVLLPAVDEGMVLVPRLGEIRATPGFAVIATQNPKEFVATSHLSEAILDRFELVVIDYQSEEDELAIVKDRVGNPGHELLPKASVRLTRMTRTHPRVRRGASVRAAISTAEICQALLTQGKDFETAFLMAALMALPTRIDIEREMESEKSAHEEATALIREWVGLVLTGISDGRSLKKKT